MVFLPGTSSVCLSLRIPRVDLERYVDSSLSSELAVDFPPNNRLQRGILFSSVASAILEGEDSFLEWDTLSGMQGVSWLQICILELNALG